MFVLLDLICRLLSICRLNWNNGDWAWIKSKCPFNVKYWPKDSQMLQRVMEKDSKIRMFPQKMLDEIGSAEDISDNVVVFSACGARDADWRDNLEIGDNLITELPVKFKYAQDGEQKNLHELNYIVKKIEGYRRDNDLIRYFLYLRLHCFKVTVFFRFTAAVKIASPNPSTSAQSPAKQQRVSGSPYKHLKTYK